MTRSLTVLPLALGVLLASGCAFGHKVAYTDKVPALTVSGSGTIALAVHDQRRRMVAKEDSPDFVGELRR